MANLVCSLAMLLALLGALGGRAGATYFEVGGDVGWVVPPLNEAGMYNQWAAKNRFLVGDGIHFKYLKDSVMVVTEEDYNKCHSTHPIFFSNNGDTEVTLDHPGIYFFISGVTGHCERGQRMILKVIGGQDAPPPVPTQTPPSSAPPSPPHPSGAAPSTIGFAGAIAIAGMLPLTIVCGV